MRTKAVNFITNTVENPLGYIGEYNETQITVTTPTEFIEDENITGLCVAFGVEGKIFYSSSVPKAETFTVDLWDEVTADSVITIQLEGTDSDGEILAKSKMLYGNFECSVAGSQSDPDLTPPLIADIMANTAARHTHSNMSVLNGLDEDIQGNLTYNGNGFATDAELALKQDLLTAGNNITIDSDNVISADIDNTREIATANNPYLSTYTPAELKAFYDAGLLLTYTNKPLVWGSYEGGEFHFGLVFTSRNGDVIHYWTDAYVNSSKTITLSTEQTAVRSVNTKTAGNANGNVTLQAGDISAAAGWSPSADTDLATKKYVDDNTGSPDWSDIQNKPTFATVATSGDYDDLLNKPTIPATQVQSDWNEADNTKVDYIKNKPTIPAAQIQSDWTQADNTKLDYIKNKPSLATVATSGSYNDLNNQPTIPSQGSISSGNTGYATGGDVYSALGNKQDTLTAGTNITIDSDNVISATGGGGSLPSGTADGDILVWDNTAQDWYAKQVRLPFAYQEVQYIESTGTQYIDTGIMPKANMRVVCDNQYTEIPSEAFFEGATNGTWAFNFGIDGTTSPQSFRGIVNNSYSWVNYGNADLNRHTWDFQSGSQKIDNVEKATTTFTQNITNPQYTMHHFARFNIAQMLAKNLTKEKLYSLRYYYGSALIRDFVPCYNKSTNDIGLYDTVEGKFYGNNGTGTFNKGADV